MATLTEDVTIRINGEDYEDYNFSGIVLTQELLKPNELRFTMQKKEMLVSADDCSFKIPKMLLGANVSLTIETIRFDQSLQVKNDLLEFEGIIFKTHIYRTEMVGEQLIDVIAYSPDFLLMDHPHCFSFEKKNLHHIVKETLKPYKIPNTIDPQMSGTIPYTVQYNETNYQFLTRLAKRYGEWMYFDGEEWVFGKVQKKDTLELYAKMDLVSYRYEILISHHVVDQIHYNYMENEEPTKSDKDLSKLTSKGYHGLTDKAKSKSEELFSKHTYQHLHGSNPIENENDELDISLKSQLFGEKSRQMICTGTTKRADLRLGSCIIIKDLYDTDGRNQEYHEHDKMLIYKLVHSCDDAYESEFTAVSANSEYPPYFETEDDTQTGKRNTNSDAYPHSLPHRATVIDNKDPDHLGRIKVQFVWQKVQDAELHTPWIRIAQPHGGKDKGFYYIPEIGEEVMVDFENGNAERPFIIGSLWHGSEGPDQDWYTDPNEVKAIRTRNGHTIEIHDEGDDGFIKIYDWQKENYVLTFSTDDKLIKLESTGNIELYAKEDIIMNAGGNMMIDVGKNQIVKIGEKQEVEVGSTQEIKVKSNRKLDVGGGENIDVSANQEVSVGGDQKITVGANLKAEARADIDLKAGISMNLSSVMHDQKASGKMKLAGGALLEAKAALVKIN